MDKACISAVADYARSLMQFCRGRYSKAIQLFAAAEAGGQSEAMEAVIRSRKLLNRLGDK